MSTVFIVSAHCQSNLSFMMDVFSRFSLLLQAAGISMGMAIMVGLTYSGHTVDAIYGRD